MDDFLQECSLLWISGKRHPLTSYRYLVVDYLRKHGNRSGSQSNSDAMLTANKYASEEDLIQVIHNQLAQDKILRDSEIPKHAAKQFNKIQRAAIILRYVWDFKEKEIAHCFGVGESYICQILTSINEKLKDTILGDKQQNLGRVNHGRDNET